MSALGQKQTFAMQKGMSALPPIADICSAEAHVRYVPIADIPEARRGLKFHFIGDTLLDLEPKVPESKQTLAVHSRISFHS